MTSSTTDNFWQAWSEPWPSAPPVFYRLYYNDSGAPIVYSMEDLPGQWIEVDQKTYLLGSHHVKVVDNKIIYQTPSWQGKKLQPDLDQGTCCHPNDVCVIVDSGQPHIKWNYQ